MQREIVIPVDAYLEPTLLVAVPALAREAAVGNVLQRRAAQLAPQQLQELACTHLEPIDVRIYEPGLSPAANPGLRDWLAAAAAPVGPDPDFLAVVTTELNRPPRAGLWSVWLMALLLATEFGGLILDHQAARVLTPAQAMDLLTPDGRLVALRQLSIFHSVDGVGRGRMTSSGLPKFGLPELEMRNLPGFKPHLGVLLNAIGQVLIEAALSAVAKRRDFDHLDVRLRLPCRLELDGVLAARANEWPAGVTPRGEPLRVELRRPTAAPCGAFIQVLPPGGQELGSWLDAVEGWLLAAVTV